MGTRAHDLDINTGGVVQIDGDNDITKFGFDYSTVNDLFATLIRIRNTNCEGFGRCNYTEVPATTATLRIASGSSNVPLFGQLSVHDGSVLFYRSGTIASNLVEGFDQGTINISHNFTAGSPLLDGVVASAGQQVGVTRGVVHTVQRINLDTAETETIDILLHDSSALWIGIVG